VREREEEQSAVRRRLRNLVEGGAALGAGGAGAVAGVGSGGGAGSIAGAPAVGAIPTAPSDGGAFDGHGAGGLAAAFDPGRRGVRVFVVVAALVVLVAAALAWRSRPRPEVVAPAVPAPTAGAGAMPVDGSSAGPVAGSTAIVAAVAGRVRRPGLVRLPAGARVADAIEAAGGVLPGTDVSFLNLARPVADGELIVVGVTPPPGLAEGGLPAAGATAAGKVNLNTATLAQLDALPGVGPVLAQRILDHRDRHGGFRSVGDLRQVDGIGDARYEQLKDLVTV
jgi:competence protein ComEA